MKTCPRCQTEDNHSFHFCKKCGYKFSGPLFGLLQYARHRQDDRQTSGEPPHSEGDKENLQTQRKGLSKLDKFSIGISMVLFLIGGYWLYERGL